MTSIESIDLPVTTPGTVRSLKVRRYGRPGARPKAYVQAGIHADELPANLAAHHLAGLLEAADRAGDVAGEVVLVPLANPIGLSNVIFNDHQGGHHAQSGQNFNRGWPNVAEAVADAVGPHLGADAEANGGLVRRAVAEELAKLVAGNEAESLRLVLMKLAADADFVLDLHTDAQAELHLYVDPDQWPGAADLAGFLGATVVMLCRNSGNDPFEETVSRPWWLTAERAPNAKLEPPFTVVVELRGEGDVSDDLARQDADALLRFLAHRGVIAGSGDAPPAFDGIAAPLEATEIVKAPAGGIVVYRKGLGDWVGAGEAIADIVDPLGDGEGARTPVLACTSGRLFARARQNLAWPGAPLAKVQGREPLPGRLPGRLMYD
ncbi:MAG TPA: succinylglutamate desuccinylase/aspartoacylase family protein [Aestuariivirgaceae bacterium]|nr:succinylglutamate desuccinylase/aspartoacylase family protein [Aestuariivirgaceae bacterium]